ncbi:MAG: hypothetical protein CM1200mP18_00860 [Gammaproteobacteria bacterium]|nr:MAG: hypothetical protein CM1200mP18_00860 [Gammaproteobacteria bacterium]
MVQTRFEDLPEDAVAATCKFILDTLGVGILGSSGPWVEELIDAQGGSPSTGVARVFARSVTLSARRLRYAMPIRCTIPSLTVCMRVPWYML